jgi:hypothetical protein
MKGFMAGRAIAVRLAELGHDPKWYLYNGVRLPALDNIGRGGWGTDGPPTLSSHPYRCIIVNQNNPRYFFMLISTASLYFDGERIRYNGDDIGWVVMETPDDPFGYWVYYTGFSQSQYTPPPSGPILWSNYAVLDAGGNEYFAKSDPPIPTT